MTTTPIPDRLDSHAKITIVFCVLVALCEGIDLQAAGVAASGIIAEMKPGPEQLGNFFGASTLGLLFGAFIGGRLADTFGRRRVLITSVGLFGLFSALTPLAWNIESLTAARLLTGLGLGGALPMLIALVSECTPGAHRAGSVAMVYAGTPFGGAVASFVTLLLPASSWRSIFLIGGVLPLILVPLMAWRLPESRAYTELVRLAGAGGAQHAALPRSGSMLAIFADGRGPRTVLLWTSFFFGLLVLYLLLNWLPTLLISDGLTRAAAGGAQIGFNIGGALSAVLIGYLISGPLRNTSIVITFIAFPLLIFTLSRAPADQMVLTALVFVLGCAVMAAQAFLYSMAPIPYPASIRGVGVGAAVAVGRIGSIVGPELGGMLKAAGHDSSRLFMDLVPLAVLTSICALLLAWKSGLRQNAVL